MSCKCGDRCGDRSNKFSSMREVDELILSFNPTLYYKINKYNTVQNVILDSSPFKNNGVGTELTLLSGLTNNSGNDVRVKIDGVIETGGVYDSESYTYIFLVRPFNDGEGAQGGLFFNNNVSNDGIYYNGTSSGILNWVYNGVAYDASASIPTGGATSLVAATKDSSEINLYWNTANVMTSYLNQAITPISYSTNMTFVNNQANTQRFAGRVGLIAAFNSKLSISNLQDIYDVVSV